MNDLFSDDKWLDDMKSLIQPDECLFPIAVKVGKNYYKINDISNPDVFKETSVVASNFKVVFGSIYNMFRNASFPINQMQKYDIIKQIQTIDEKTQVDTLFFVFESDYRVDDDLTVFDDCINTNYDMLIDYVSSMANANRKRMLESFYNNNNY